MKPRVIVTGASRGIGRAVARRLGREGYLVGINYARSVKEAERLLCQIQEEGNDAYLIPFDIADRKMCKSILEEDLAKRGDLWGIVCNAGIAMDAPFPLLEDEMWDRVLGTNLDGFYNVLKPLVMPMVKAKAGGRIVAMSSVSGLTGNRGQVNYAASKAGIVGAAKSLALELAKRNITVNVVAPGLIETEMVGEVNKDDAIKMIPMRRFGNPDEVAALTNFLVSREAGYITGQVISINGGIA